MSYAENGHLCDQKCVSLLYLSIRTEGRRLLTQKFPHDNIYDLTTLKLWEMMEIAFLEIVLEISALIANCFSQESRKKAKPSNSSTVF